LQRSASVADTSDVGSNAELFVGVGVVLVLMALGGWLAWRRRELTD
jgi:LPXTG-motif cell wall-anchored protein